MKRRFAQSYSRRHLAAAGARILATGLALTASTTWAGLIVDPSALNVALGDGADISTAVVGVTLSAPDNAGDTAVYTKDWAGLPQFTYDGMSFNSFTFGARLKAVFDNPMTSVSVTFGLGGVTPVGWSGEVLAYDATNAQVDTEIMVFTAEGLFPLTVSGDIKYITATFQVGPNPNFPDFVGLTRLEAVPEPGTFLGGLAMFGACAGFVLYRRRTPTA